MRNAGDASRGAFRQTVTAVRAKLLEDIRTETEHRYSLAARDRSTLRLRPAEAADWAIIEPELAHLDELIREKAYTLANRLAFLFMLEARGLRAVNLVRKGTALSPLRDSFTALIDE